MAVTSSGERDFNLLLLNLFLGLLRGDRTLKPHARLLLDLGYCLFGVEVAIRVAARGRHKVCPEAIAHSKVNEHTLLAEWTRESDVSNRKREQLSRYAAITSEDLNNIGVNASAVASNSTWLVVHESGEDTFMQAVKEITKGPALILLSIASLSSFGGLCLKYVFGSLKDIRLSQRLATELMFKRVPRGYVLVSTDNLQSCDFADATLQQIVAFAVKGYDGFSTEEIAREMFSVWHVYDPSKKSTIRNRITELVNRLVKKKHCSWIVRVEGSKPTWKFSVPYEADLPRYLRLLKGQIAELRDEFSRTKAQFDLFEDYYPKIREVQGKAKNRRKA